MIITPAAREKLLEFMANATNDPIGIRVGIRRRTPMGTEFSLGLQTTTEVKDDDVIHEVEGIKVHIPAEDLEGVERCNIDFLKDARGSGFQVTPGSKVWEDPETSRMQEVFDTQINPQIASHGGRIELLDYKDDKVFVELQGGCAGCGMANVTLKNGVEQMLKQTWPNIKEIVDTTDHSAGTNPYYKPGGGGADGNGAGGKGGGGK